MSDQQQVRGAIYCIQTQAIRDLYGSNAYKFGKYSNLTDSLDKNLKGLYERYFDDTYHYGSNDCQILYYYQVGSISHAERFLFEVLVGNGFKRFTNKDDPTRKKTRKNKRDLEIFEIPTERFFNIGSYMSMASHFTAEVINDIANYNYIYQKLDPNDIQAILKNKNPKCNI